MLPIRKLENVIAIEFDVKNNCVFWADIVTDTIGVINVFLSFIVNILIGNSIFSASVCLMEKKVQKY